MSDKTKQTEAEPKEKIFEDSAPAEDHADLADDTAKSEPSEPKSDLKQGQRPLELKEKAEEPSKAMVERQKQVDAWTIKIIKGEASLDSLEGNLQWLYLPVKRQLDSLDKAPEIDELLDKKLAEKEDQREFNALKDQLKSVQLTNAQRAELEAEYGDLRGAGMAKSKALTKAIKLAGIKLDNSTSELRKRMALPEAGYYRAEDEEGAADDLEKIVKIKDPQKRLAQLEKVRKARTQ
jgi:hypothetical protein